MAFLGLGSNVGDRQSYLQRAVRALMDERFASGNVIASIRDGAGRIR